MHYMHLCLLFKLAKLTSFPRNVRPPFVVVKVNISIQGTTVFLFPGAWGSLSMCHSSGIDMLVTTVMPGEKYDIYIDFVNLVACKL